MADNGISFDDQTARRLLKMLKTWEGEPHFRGFVPPKPGPPPHYDPSTSTLMVAAGGVAFINQGTALGTAHISLGNNGSWTFGQLLGDFSQMGISRLACSAYDDPCLRFARAGCYKFDWTQYANQAGDWPDYAFIEQITGPQDPVTYPDPNHYHTFEYDVPSPPWVDFISTVYHRPTTGGLWNQLMQIPGHMNYAGNLGGTNNWVCQSASVLLNLAAASDLKIHSYFANQSYLIMSADALIGFTSTVVIQYVGNQRDNDL
jgi:hypothetical protein